MSGMDERIYFTPTWTSTGINPKLENGTLTGEYNPETSSVIVKLIIGSKSFTGAGSWKFKVPTEYNLSGGFYNAIGHGHREFAGLVYIDENNEVMCIINRKRLATVPLYDSPLFIGPADPFIWLAFDELKIILDVK